MEHRLRQHCRSRTASSRRCTVTISAIGRGFRLDPLLIAPRERINKTSFGAGLLERRAHERVDQLLQHDLARDGLRDLDHRREIEVFDRCRDRACRSRCAALPCLSCGYSCIELPHLAVGSPAEIAVAGRFADRDARSSRSRAPRRSARRARWRAPRCGQSRLRWPSGWPVRKGAWHRARGLRSGRSPRRPARRGSRNSPGNARAQTSSCLWWAARASRCCCRWSADARIAGCRVAERTVEVILRRFEHVTVMSTAAVAPSMRPRWRPHSRRQRSAPAACGSSTSTRPAPDPGCLQKWRSNRSSSNCSSSKEPNVGVKPRSVRISPSWVRRCGQWRDRTASSAQTRDHARLRACTSASGSPAARRFVFRWVQQYAAKVRSPIWFAASNARRTRSRPARTCLVQGMTQASKVQIGPGLEALQPALFDQVIAEPAESKSGLVVAEVRPGDHAKHCIGEARAVAVAALEAEIDCPADDQGKQVRIRIQGRRPRAWSEHPGSRGMPGRSSKAAR